MGDNPQFRLTLEGEPGKAVHVWALLSRHITSIKDFAENNEYIACHIFEGGRRIYHPDDALHRGVKINSPHYLAKLELPPGKHALTVVISQYEKANTLRFTLGAYSTARLALAPMPDPYAHGGPTQTVHGKWTAETAGGSTNDPERYRRNPKWRLVVEGGSGTAQVRIQLFGPRRCSVGLELRVDGAGTVPVHSGDYRTGMAVLESSVPVGARCTLVPSTFRPSEVPYVMRISASARFTVAHE